MRMISSIISVSHTHGGVKMSEKIEIKMDAGSLSGFVLYHNYVRPGGLIGLLLSVVAIGALIIRWGEWSNVQRCLLILLALLFLVFQPLMLLQKANSQFHTDAFQIPMNYEFTDDSFSIAQKDKREEFHYEDIRKAVLRKNVMYLYMTNVSAFIIPRRQCGDAFDVIRDKVKENRRR